MSVSGHPKIFRAVAVCLLLIVPGIAGFLAQNSQPAPSPSAHPSPTASVTPSPESTRSPSPTPLPGAQNFHQWGSITIFNGLPSDSVRAIAQTLDGVMWFGTDNGLARFDGRRVQKFSLGGSYTDRITALKTAPKGELWIGTSSGSMVYTDNRFIPVEGTRDIGITTILSGREIALGTDAGFAFRISRDESGTLIAEKLHPDPILDDDGNPVAITGLVEDEEGLIVGTSGRGPFRLEDGKVSEFRTSPRPIFVNSLAKGEEGKLWLATDAQRGFSGIYMVESGSRAVRVGAKTAKVLALETNESGLWAGTERYGLFQLEGSKLTRTYTFENTSGGLRSNTIFSLFTDREGVVWIGTNRGVSRFDRLGPLQQTVSDLPNSNFIRTIYQAPGETGLLYAGSNRGLFSKHQLEDKWIDVPGFKNKVIYAVRKRYRSSIVVGTADGMFDITGKKLFEGDVRCFAGFNMRDYAAIFGRGVFDVTGDTPQLVIANETVTSIAERWNKLWIGTSGHGLFSYDGLTIKKEAGPDVLKSGTIWNMFQSPPEGPLYVAGQHGVFTFRDGDVEQIVAAEDVRDVTERDGQVWAATTTRGLLLARHYDRFGWLVSSVGFEQGLPSEKAFSIQHADKELIIATNRGVVNYRPGTVAPKLIPTRILSQRLHDLSEAGSTISLEYPQNSILVEVAGQSSRTFPEEFQYAFVLRDSRGDAIESRLSNDPQYAMTNLKPGEYSIESIAFNRDLLASEPLVIHFSIDIAPFPWTATALGVLLAIAIAALVWAVIEHRRIASRNRALAAARFDLANEAERERRRIARDLHDQTLADLRTVLISSDRIAPQNPEFRNEIEAVSTEIRRICEDLSPSVLENVGLIAALEFLLASTISEHRFSSTENAEDRVRFPMNVQLQIYRIAQEVLTNIRRHANAGTVEMQVSVGENEEFELTIVDNGLPFEPSKNSTNGRGIPNIRSRASLINAHVSWEKLDTGTRFKLRREQETGVQ